MRLGNAFEQLPNGFEHYYIFAASDGGMGKVAEFTEATAGRSLEVYTTEPGMLFYTGYYTSDDLQREDGTRFGQFRAFLLRNVKVPQRPQYPGIASQYSASWPAVRRDDDIQVRMVEKSGKAED